MLGVGLGPGKRLTASPWALLLGLGCGHWAGGEGWGVGLWLGCGARFRFGPRAGAGGG